MKPLELINYVRTTCPDGCCTKWADPRDWSLIDRDWGTEHKPNTDRSDYDASKRLIDAELAAEYWRYEKDLADSFWKMPKPPSREAIELAEEQDRRVETMERFATLPHYDEVAG